MPTIIAPMESIGRYQVVRELGRGGMGVVYEARDPVIDRAVALKTIRNSDGLDPRVFAELSERFLREARAAGRLTHPHIAGVLDAGTDAGTGVSYIAMEMVRGGDLDHELRSGRRFSADEAANLVAAAADALDFAHRQGVVHRDVKPGNLLLDEQGRVKLTDFGIAHLVDSGITRTGQIIGSPAYMSPEQITGAAVDGRSDVFSLGVVLYQLLTSERPFLGEGLTTLSYQIVHTEPIPVRKVNPALPASFDPILARALAKNPADRYQRAADLATDLRGGTELGVVAARPSAATTAAATGTMTEAPGARVERTLLGVPERATGTLLDAPPQKAPATGSVPRSQASRIRPWAPIALGVVVLAVLLMIVFGRRGRSPETAPGDMPDARAAQRARESARRATPLPTRVPSRSEPASSETREEKATSLARVHIDCEHFLGTGTVTLTVDDEEIWSSPLNAKKQTKVKIPLLKKGPRIQASNEKLAADIEVPGGQHTVRVRMFSREADIDDSDTKVAQLRAGSATVWRIRLNRITRKVSLDVSP